jgi:[1-hydroxy-2-(trimethylamino)ethyl]phosphonate dioxygenase
MAHNLSTERLSTERLSIERLSIERPSIESSPAAVADAIIAVLREHGDAAYFGEPVSQRAHALQCAALAVREGASPWLVGAALLHDIGHLLHGLDESIADEGVDARHEDAGHDWLARHFRVEVTEPVRLHVDAKRYLCAADPTYVAALSPASVQSLALQGGAFTRSQALAFADLPFAAEAIRLRRWDDAAKIAGLDVPDVEHYRALLTSLVLTHEEHEERRQRNEREERDS